MENKRNHPILQHPLLAMVLLMCHGFLWTSIANIAGWISDIACSCAIILVGVLLLVVHKRWFRPEFRGNVSTAFTGDKTLLLCMAVFLGFDIVTIGIEYFVSGFAGFSIALLLNALCAGFSEEVICRALAISTMMRAYKDKNTIWPALILPAILFGLIHFALVFSSGSISGAITTVISAAFAGVFFAALYLRSGSVLPSAILHFLHDLLAMMVLTGTSDGDTYAGVVYFALLALMLVLSIVLVRGHKAEIIALWKERWSDEAAPAEE